MGTKQNLLLAFLAVLVFFSCSKSEDFVPNNEVEETTVVEEAAGKIVFGMGGNAPVGDLALSFPCVSDHYLIMVESDGANMLQFSHVKNSSVTSLFNPLTITWTINNQTSTLSSPILPLEDNGSYAYNVNVSVYGTIGGTLGTQVYTTSLCVKVDNKQVSLCSSETYMQMAGCNGPLYNSGGSNGSFSTTATYAPTFIGDTTDGLDINKDINDPDASVQKPGGGTGSFYYVMP